METKPATLPVAYVLKDPIDLAGKIYESFELTRKVKVKDMKGLDLNDPSQVLSSTSRLYARLFNVPATVFDEMSFEDFVTLGEVVQPFLGLSRRTGQE
jgi:hypothetical protein